MAVGEVGVSSGSPVPPMPEQPTDQGQILARHHGMTGGGVAKVMQAQLAQLCVHADGPPAGFEAVDASPFGMERKQESVRLPVSGQAVDMHPCGLSKRYGARAGLAIGQGDSVGPDIAPA